MVALLTPAPSRVSVCRRLPSRPPQVNPLCPGCAAPPTPPLPGDVRWGRESPHRPPQPRLLLECFSTQHTLASRISQSCAQDLQISAQPEVPPGRSQGGLHSGRKVSKKGLLRPGISASSKEHQPRVSSVRPAMCLPLWVAQKKSFWSFAFNVQEDAVK